MTLVGYAVAALFILVGFYVIFSKKLAIESKEMRNILGIVAIGYGVFRSVIIYQKSKHRNEEDES